MQLFKQHPFHCLGAQWVLNNYCGYFSPTFATVLEKGSIILLVKCFIYFPKCHSSLFTKKNVLLLKEITYINIVYYFRCNLIEWPIGMNQDP